METQTEKGRTPNGQLISVTRKDTTRLLEVYVKRSLSLNDGALLDKKTERRKKWVTMPQKRIRRHSSDPSVHLAPDSNDGEIGEFAAAAAAAAAAAPETPPTNQPETQPDEPEKMPKKTKKSKKSSLWKSFLGLFSRKGSEEKEGEQESRPDASEVSTSQEASSDAAGAGCLPATPDSVRKRKSTKRKSMRRKFSKRRLSLKKSSKPDPAKDLNTVESVVIVEPTYSYYEKVSEEMEKIVHEVKEKEEVLTNEEVINRIIALTKQQGDAIDDKLKENPALNNFFQKISYSCFQQLADAYVETETTPTNNNHPSVLPPAPELVKLAFTLDFTARVAGLSKQNIGHITGLGNRYLEDRFEYKQACTDHPWSDCDEDND
ncbi:bcl-2-like protein 12 [Centroberyx affinis]|uniref:bcl-2-like protein 12 n=1 Tax=Centroberyx affinis TaxID=166261 RepID=UPI003A5C3B51